MLFAGNYILYAALPNRPDHQDPYECILQHTRDIDSNLLPFLSHIDTFLKDRYEAHVSDNYRSARCFCVAFDRFV